MVFKRGFSSRNLMTGIFFLFFYLVSFSSLPSWAGGKGPCCCDCTNYDLALLDAVQVSDRSRALQALKAGADINVVELRRQNPKYLGDTPLITATKRQSAQLVQLLLNGFSSECPAYYQPDKHDVLVNYQRRDKMGSSALHFACYLGSLEITQLLVQAKADLELENKGESCPPLSKAACFGHTDIVAYLLSQRARVDHEDGKKDTSLHYAAQEGHHDIVLLLLNAKAQPNRRGECGFTALHSAASKSAQLETVQLLIERKADPRLRDELRSDECPQGRTALDLADNEDIIIYLRKYLNAHKPGELVVPSYHEL